MTVMERGKEKRKAGHKNPAGDVSRVVLTFIKSTALCCCRLSQDENFKCHSSAQHVLVFAVAAAVSGKMRMMKAESEIIPSLF